MQYSLRCDDILWVVSCFLVLARLARDRFRTRRSSSSWNFLYGGPFLSTTSNEDRPDGSQAVRAGLVWRGSCDVLPLLGQEVLLSYRVSFREEDFAQSLIYKRTAVSASLLSKTESPEVDGGVAGYLWGVFQCFAWTLLLYSDLAM